MGNGYIGNCRLYMSDLCHTMISSNEKGVYYGHYTYSMVNISARFIGHHLLPRTWHFGCHDFQNPQGNQL